MFNTQVKLSLQDFNNFLQKWINDENIPFIFGVLANVDENNRAKSRTLTLQEVTGTHVLFYTQQNSSKISEIRANNQVSLTIILPKYKRQIIFDGIVNLVASEENSKYWKSYPDKAKLRFLAYGPESGKPIKSNSPLDNLVETYAIKYNNVMPECPDSFISCKIYPTKVKLYQWNDDRISDSLILTRIDDHFKITRVIP